MSEIHIFLSALPQFTLCGRSTSEAVEHVVGSSACKACVDSWHAGGRPTRTELVDLP